MKPVNMFSIVTRTTIVILAAFACSQFIGCSGTDTPAPSVNEQVKAKLTAEPWTVSSVTVDGINQSSLFNGFGITFTATGFTTVNGGPVWPSSGSWTFTDENATAFTRGDGLIVVLQEVTNTSLKMQLTWNKTTLGPGRVESIDGQHVFTMGN